jgi:hypothetical protein
MRIASLVFDPAPRTPTLRGPGIAITVTQNPARKAWFAFEITCRLPRAILLEAKWDLPAGIFLTAVHSHTQRPETLPLLGERVLFAGDVAEGAEHCVAVARGELDASTGPVGAFLLHASCFQFVSNVVYVS